MNCFNKKAGKGECHILLLFPQKYRTFEATAGPRTFLPAACLYSFDYSGLFSAVLPSPDDIVVIAGEAVDQTVRRNLHDAVGDRIDEFVVVGCEQHVALEVDEAVVDRRDGFQIQVVRRLIENEDIRAEEHHSREHASHLFATGQNFYRLIYIVAGKEHSSQETSHESLCRLFCILPATGPD